MNQRTAKAFRKAVGRRTDMPDEEKRGYYRMVKADYTKFKFLASQTPKPVLTKRQRRNARVVAKLKG
jgi:hypothetical protein